MLQLDPPIPVDTPKGPVYAHQTIDYSQEHYLLFVRFLTETDEGVGRHSWVLLRVNLSSAPPTPGSHSIKGYLHIPYLLRSDARRRVGLSMICLHEVSDNRRKTNGGTCAFCWR